MKIETTINGELQLTEIFDPIILKTKDGSKFNICMRDGGFEINFNGAKYSAQGDTIIQMP